MLTKKFKSYFSIFVVLFLLGGVYLGYANVWLCVATFVMVLMGLNREEFVFVMLITGAEYFGAVARVFIGFTIVPQFVVYLIVLLILFRRLRALFRQNKIANYLFLLLLLVFIISYLYGPQHAYSNTKLLKIILYGLLCFWTFLIYSGKSNIDPRKLVYVFAIVSVTYVVMGVTIYNFGTPSSIFDFEYFGRHVQHDADSFTLSYHTVGLAALYGVVFLLSSRDDKYILAPRSIILLLILIFIALISQMRQGILGIFVLLFVRYVLLVKGKMGYKLVGIFFLLGIMICMFNEIQTAAFQSIVNAQTFEEVVNRPYDKVLTTIYEYPWFGLGLGGYSYDGTVAYPHNIFLEVIIEMGFVGLTFIVIISLCAMWHNRFSWKAVNANNTYAILLLIALFIRVNASNDLSENIYFFALLFSMSNMKHVVTEYV